MSNASEIGCEERVLVLAPTGRDAALTAAILNEEGLAAEICDSIDGFCGRVEQGAGAGVIAEEALRPDKVGLLSDTMAKQPPWSDLPLMLLTGRAGPKTDESRSALEPFERLRNIMLLERPMRRETLLSALRMALRARRRQYEIRDHLIERERAAAALRESEQLFRLALRNSPVRVAHVDRELRFTWMYNPHPDLKPEQALGKRLDEILPAEDVADLMRIREEVLASGRGIRREVAVTYPSGRLLFDVAAEPLHDAAGKVIGVTTVSTDLAERKRAEDERARLAAIVESSFDAIMSRRLDGRIETWNAAAERMFGYSAAEAIGRDIMIIVPPERRDELEAINETLAAGDPVRPFETVRMTKDGRQLDVSIAISPLKNAAGKVVGASVVTRDITERRRAQEQQRMLLAELSHRVKNTLTVVLSIATQTLARADSLEAFSQSFRGRIQALAAAHSLLTAVNWQAAELRALVEQALRPYRSDGEENIEILGHNVSLRPDAALTLSLILHELTTNAAKYGALAAPSGRVRIDWSVNDAADGQRFRLCWHESGGPPASRPAKLGFGLQLIERSIAYEFEGGASFDFRPEGLSCELDVPWTPTIGELRAA